MVERTHLINQTFVGCVTSVSLEPSYLEGLKQKQYSLEIKNEDDETIYEWVQMGTKETEDVTLENSALDLYLNEVEKACPEIKNIATSKEALEFLKGKKFKWVRIPIGKKYFDIPPRLYWVPRKLESSSEQQG